MQQWCCRDVCGQQNVPYFLMLSTMPLQINKQDNKLNKLKMCGMTRRSLCRPAMFSAPSNLVCTVTTDGEMIKFQVLTTLYYHFTFPVACVFMRWILKSTYQLSWLWLVVLRCWRGQRCASRSRRGPAWWQQQQQQQGPVGKLGGSWVTCSRMP